MLSLWVPDRNEEAKLSIQQLCKVSQQPLKLSEVGNGILANASDPILSAEAAELVILERLELQGLE